MRDRIHQSTVRASYVLTAAFAVCLFSLTTASAQQESPSAFVIVQRTATMGVNRSRPNTQSWLGRFCRNTEPVIWHAANAMYSSKGMTQLRAA
jgi:hypothetical protein